MIKKLILLFLLYLTFGQFNNCAVPDYAQWWTNSEKYKSNVNDCSQWWQCKDKISSLYMSNDDQYDWSAFIIGIVRNIKDAYPNSESGEIINKVFEMLFNCSKVKTVNDKLGLYMVIIDEARDGRYSKARR